MQLAMIEIVEREIGGDGNKKIVIVEFRKTRKPHCSARTDSQPIPDIPFMRGSETP
jgi:hypothetical protein